MSGRGAAWDDLVTTATLGTDRRPVDLGTWSGPAGELARALGSTGPALLLDAAALATAYRRAGAAPAALDVGPAPEAPAAVRPEVPAAAARRLRELLDAGEPDLLREWLGLVAQAGRRAPADCLPPLLDLAAGPHGLGPDVAAVLDLPGAWLAGFRADWTRAVAAAAPLDGPPPVTWWTHGTLAQRVAWLRHLREQDSTSGRVALEQVWGRETADDRRTLLAELERGLGPADEPLLEQALDDRSGPVRQAAAVLLSRLPGSALTRRWEQRLHASVSVQQHALHGRRVVLRGEPDLDDALRRDLAGARPGAQPLLLLAAAPAVAWSSVLGEPDAFVPLPVEGAERVALQEIWSHAAQRDGDIALARALLDDGRTSAGLLTLLPRTERSRRAVRLLATAPDPAAATEVLLACERPWDVVLVDAVLALAGSTSRDAAAAVRGRRLLGLLAERADARDPAAAVRLRRVLDLLPVSSPLQSSAQRAWERLALRVQLHAELRDPLAAPPPEPDPPADPTGGPR